MKIITQGFQVLTDIDGPAMLRRIEAAGRTCYKSEDKITDDSAERFVRMITHQRKHHSVLEHESISVRVICDRGISHEIVRHRIAAYSQESTRFCNYGKEKFGIEIAVIEPPGLLPNGVAYNAWVSSVRCAEAAYFSMLEAGVKPQIARSVLPTCLKTELVVTYNLRQWRHFFTMRCARDAHPQVREIAIGLLSQFSASIPVVFEDLAAEYVTATGS